MLFVYSTLVGAHFHLQYCFIALVVVLMFAIVVQLLGLSIAEQ